MSGEQQALGELGFLQDRETHKDLDMIVHTLAAPCFTCILNIHIVLVINMSIEEANVIWLL